MSVLRKSSVQCISGKSYSDCYAPANQGWQKKEREILTFIRTVGNNGNFHRKLVSYWYFPGNHISHICWDVDSGTQNTEKYEVNWMALIGRGKSLNTWISAKSTKICQVDSIIRQMVAELCLRIHQIKNLNLYFLVFSINSILVNYHW